MQFLTKLITIEIKLYNTKEIELWDNSVHVFIFILFCLVLQRTLSDVVANVRFGIQPTLSAVCHWLSDQQCTIKK